MANGGVLVIDDFAGSGVRLRDLLNRWIVPLESRVDFLTLNNGQKFELPFLLLVVFATNIRPSELVDEAFCDAFTTRSSARARRSPISRIFAKCCAERRIEYDGAHRGAPPDLLPPAKTRAPWVSPSRPARPGARPGVIPR